MNKENEKKKGEDIIEETEKLGKAVQRFVQKSEFSAFERLVCSYLVQAITGSPLETVIYTMRAAMTLDDERIKILKINQEIVKSIYAVAQMITTATKTGEGENIYDKNMRIHTQSLDWKKDLEPWVKQEMYAFTYSGYGKEDELIEEIKESKDKQKKFEFSCGRLSLQGFEHLKSDFLRYAMPISQEITRKLSEIISPTTYEEIFRLFTGVQVKTPMETRR